MLKFKCILIVALYLSGMISACAPATPATVLPRPTSTYLPPTLPPTVAPPVLVPTSEPVAVGVPVIKYNNGQSVFLVISAVTGRAFDAFKPIPLGDESYSFSPDGRTLALVSDGQLYLIDLQSWKFRTFDVETNGRVSSVVYSPDGTLLALASGESDGAIWVVDAKSGEVKTSVQTGFSIKYVKFTTDGKAIMVYGPQLAPNNGISVGLPKAALFSVSDLSKIWSVELNGIRDGIFPKKADTTDIYQPGAAWFFTPGIAFSPNRDILYLVHGDEDKMTTVDFTHQKVTTVSVHVKTSWLDQLMALTASVAYAKGMDGTTKQAVISADGKFLFVTGNTEVVTKQANNIDWDVTDTSIGLQVIATEDGTLVDKKDTDANSIALSHDSTQVFLTGWKKEIYGAPWTDVYDISSKSIIKHLDGVYLIPTRRMDGKAILASSSTISDNMNDMTVIDPDSWEITGEWQDANYFGWLVVP